MLRELTVKNFALIEYINLSLGEHLNVLSGETGAGKSIIIDAVKLLLGERANLRDIRIDSEYAMVEGVFSVNPHSQIAKQLADEGFDEEVLILTRMVRTNGKNTCRINNRTVTLHQFRSLACELINIYGQHDYQALANQKKHLSLLDGLGDGLHVELKEQVQCAYLEAKKSAKALKEAIGAGKLAVAEQKRLEHNLNELMPLRLKKEEESQLSIAYHRAVHAESLRESTNLAYDALYGGNRSCNDLLSRSIQQLEQAVEIDPELAAITEELETARIIIEEASRTLGSMATFTETDDKLEVYGERLSLLDGLKRKYGMSIDALVDQMVIWQQQLNTMDHYEQEITDCHQVYQHQKQVFETLCQQLTESRKQIASDFSNRLLAELADLSMKHAHFYVAFEEKKASSLGVDEATFMLAANPGHAAQPLQEVASGGEMSRIMLAFKTILTTNNDSQCLIFDEIDTGIGGVTLNQVATKLEKVSEREQVICVTHAPVIAARADDNFFIHKTTDGTHTKTFVRALKDQEVINELARMLGGTDDWHISHAQKLRNEKMSNKIR